MAITLPKSLMELFLVRVKREEMFLRISHTWMALFTGYHLGVVVTTTVSLGTDSSVYVMRL